MDFTDPHTIDMTKKFVRQALPFIGGGLTLIGLPGVAAGLGAAFNNYDTIMAGLGLLLTAGSAVWTAAANTKVQMTAKVDAFPEVAGVILKTTPAAKAIAEKIPDPIIVGTDKAQKIAVTIKPH